jgi:hypothetical protein
MFLSSIDLLSPCFVFPPWSVKGWRSKSTSSSLPYLLCSRHVTIIFQLRSEGHPKKE